MVIKDEIKRFGCILIVVMLHLQGTAQGNNDGIFYSSLNYATRLGQLDGLVTFERT
jgi:hypothetical protein